MTQDAAGIDRRTFLKGAALTAAAGAAANTFDSFGATLSGKRAIYIPKDAHPAVQSAAMLLANKPGMNDARIRHYSSVPHPHTGAIVLAVAGAKGVPASLASQIKQDGYAVQSSHDGLLVCGARPRSLLFAAGEPHHWLDLQGNATYLRNPSFALRMAVYHPAYSVAEQVAMLGANHFSAVLHASVSFREELPEIYAKLGADDKQRLDDGAKQAAEQNAKLVRDFHDADVVVYANLPYGNNFSRWSPALYQAALEVYPSAKGVPQEHSWEKAALCPSDPATWKILEAYVKECALQSSADGVSATFWDAYGMFCHDPRCRQNGLDHFKNELYESIRHYHLALSAVDKKLHLRTWSSGCPHWLGEEYVHAPGYGQFSESHYELWSRVVKETPADVLMQTKVYHSDCEPNPPFSTMLGQCKPHTEIVEYQMVGQTIGRQYFPASTVNYTAWTMKTSLELVGPDGGAQIDAGGTMQTNYDIYADMLNNVNVYAWRELTWDVNTDLDGMWADWSRSLYSEGAAPHIARAMRLSEEAVYTTFSPLGHGSATNSDFAGNIKRRETLLRYTNRYYLPEYAKFLTPTKENIDRIVAEKAECLQTIDKMFSELEAAKPFLTREQAEELTTRFNWLRQFAVCNVTLDSSLWRYRYLRSLDAMLTTDPEQMKPLAEAYDLVSAHAPLLFQHDPGLKFTCYDVPLSGLKRKPSLGSPLPLMQEIYSRSLALVEDSTGPGYLPQEVLRSTSNQRA